MTQDEGNLDLLGIFHYIVGGIAALFSMFFIFHIAIGIGMVTGGLDGGKAPPPTWFGWIFIAMGSVFLLCGLTLAVNMIVAGRRLRARKSRTYCLVVAAVECIFMPLGTVLGIFTIIVLSKEPVKALFAAHQGQSALLPPPVVS